MNVKRRNKFFIENDEGDVLHGPFDTQMEADRFMRALSDKAFSQKLRIEKAYEMLKNHPAVLTLKRTSSDGNGSEV